MLQCVAHFYSFADVSMFACRRIAVPKESAQKSKYYYISVHTQEIYKFFPFTQNESERLMALIQEITGKQPFLDQDFIKNILV